MSASLVVCVSFCCWCSRARDEDAVEFDACFLAALAFFRLPRKAVNFVAAETLLPKRVTVVVE